MADDSGSENQQPWEMHIESGAEMQAKEQADRAAMRQAVYDNLESRRQYGSNRSLYAPDGRYEGVHYRYQRSTPHHRSRTHYHGRRQSPPVTARPSYDSLMGGWTGHSHYGDSQPSKGFWATLREWFPVFFGG